MSRAAMSVVVTAILVALAGLVPVGAAEAMSMGEIDVILDSVPAPPEPGPGLHTVGMGKGEFSDAAADGSFAVRFSYDAMYVGSDRTAPHQLMVSGDGKGQLILIGLAQPAQAESPASLNLSANVVVDGTAVATVPIGTLTGLVLLDAQGNPQVPGSNFGLVNPVGPFTLPGTGSFIFPIGDHRIIGRPQQVPDPGMLLVLGAGLAGLGAIAWGRRRSG